MKYSPSSYWGSPTIPKLTILGGMGGIQTMKIWLGYDLLLLY